MGKYRLLLYLEIWHLLKKYGTFFLYLTTNFPNPTDPMGLQISKRYSSHKFELISAKRYKDIDNHCGMQVVTFLGDLPIIEKYEILTFFS